MQIFFNSQNTTFKFLKRQDHSAEYLNIRDQIWQEQLEKSKFENWELHNGEIYTIQKVITRDLLHTEIQFSTCEYKDIVLKQKILNVNKVGVQHVEPLRNEFELHATVGLILKTSDNKFVFGIRNNKTLLKSGSIGLIGGTLNKDELEIQNFDDIAIFAKKEFQEELNLNPEEFEFKFYSLNQFSTKYEFLYLVNSNLDSNTLISKVILTEFEKLVAMTKEEVIGFSSLELNAFSFAKSYIEKI